MDAQDILARVVEVYARCETYRDEVVHTDHFDGEHPHTKVLTFATRFIRNGGFRFDMRERKHPSVQNEYTIWKEGNETCQWWNFTGQKRVDTLEAHIGAATGVSSGVSSRVPRLLLPDECRPGNWQSPRLSGITSDATAERIRIEFMYRHDWSEAWIVDPATLMIVRCESDHVVRTDASTDASRKHGAPATRTVEGQEHEQGDPVPAVPLRVRSVTEYQAKMNVQVLPEETRFTPDPNGSPELLKLRAMLQKKIAEGGP